MDDLEAQVRAVRAQRADERGDFHEVGPSADDQVQHSQSSSAPKTYSRQPLSGARFKFSGKGRKRTIGTYTHSLADPPITTRARPQKKAAPNFGKGVQEPSNMRI